MKHTIYILILLLALTAGLYAQNTMSSPVDFGTISSSFTFRNTQNTANYTNNYSGRSSNDVFYKFTLSVPMEVEISHCGSALNDTYMHLLDALGSLIVSVDDYSGEGQCPNTYHPYHKRQLAAGTYYVVSEGYSGNGNITTTITGTGTASAATVDIGTKSAGFSYTDTKNTANAGNNYTGRTPNDVLYKFTLSVPMEITASHCGSELNDTYMHLLDASRNLIVSVDDYSGEGKCPNAYHPVIRRQLPAGTYYIVSEGYGGSGNITTTITGSSNVPVTHVFLNQASLSLTATGQTAQLTETVIPSNATNKNVNWTSSNTAVATVSITGLVTAKAEGTATVAVTTADGNRTAACSVTVYASATKAPPIAAVPSSNQNYIKTRTCTSESGLHYMDAIQYYDGLGRPSQTVQVGITPNQSDLTSLQEYDSFGRESKAWLPAIVAGNNRGAFVADFSSKSTATYNNTTYNSAADSKPFTYPVYESSPLNRVEQQYGPGQSWQDNGKSVKTDYLTNSSDYPCAYYYVSGDNLVRSNNYGNGQLYVTRITDEEGNVSYEFKDKLGRVVLQRQMDGTNPHDTYYVYDDFGNLRYVLPPLAADATSNGNYDENSTIIKSYAYVYKYDERNRCKYKQLPGCSPVYYVYDRADRLIFSQDGEQRNQGKWMFTLYDALGRPAVSGTCTNSIDYNSNPVKNTVVTASTSTNSTLKGYSSSYTVNNPVVLTANYYDGYDFRGFITDISFDTSAGAEFNKQYTGGYKGLLTGTLTAVLDGNATPTTYLYSVMYYDSRGRVIQTVSSNHLGGTKKEYVAYTFTGQPEKRKHVHTAPGKPSQREIYAYDYDHAERLIRTSYKLGFESEIVMNVSTYDELGRLKTTMPYNLENFKSTYAYNIRSWTSRISSTPYTEDLTYRYNGNVETMQWQQGGATRKYTFSYDGLSRLAAANYIAPSGSAEQYSTTYDYDKNGNFTDIVRRGLVNTGIYNTIDHLTFRYKGNQLFQIEDGGMSVLLNTSYDFKGYYVDPKGHVYIYTFNKNGALTQDLNKGISEIAYNVLNQPLKVDIKSPVAEARNEYVYSADGQKLRVVHKWNPSYSASPIIGSSVNAGSLTASKTNDYIGSFVYENGAAKRVLTENGYYEGRNYYFYIKNHLGSNVMVINKDTGNIAQNNHYFPFGLTMGGISTGQGEQAYKYTGKELDMEHGLMLYDYLARQYDPAVGRFTTIDPLAEKYYSVSPYAYCLNNPVKYIDPTGEEVWLTMYENGEFKEKILYTQGMKYEGKNEFFQKAVSVLNKMNSVDAGSKVLQSLTSSDNQYFYTNIAPKDGADAGTVPTPNGNTYFTMTANPSLSNTAHELFHGYQLENGVGGQSITNEVEANAFSYSVMDNYAINNISDPESQAFFNSSAYSMGKNTWAGNLYNSAFQNLTSNNRFIAEIGYANASLWFKTGSRANSTGHYNKYPFQGQNRNPGLLRSFFPLTKKY